MGKKVIPGCLIKNSGVVFHRWVEGFGHTARGSRNPKLPSDSFSSKLYIGRKLPKCESPCENLTIDSWQLLVLLLLAIPYTFAKVCDFL